MDIIIHSGDVLHHLHDHMMGGSIQGTDVGRAGRERDSCDKVLQLVARPQRWKTGDENLVDLKVVAAVPSPRVC